MKKAFQDCFRPFLILTLNIIINQDDKQIKIIECPQKNKQNVPLWVSTIGSNLSLSCIKNIRYMNINRPFNRDRLTLYHAGGGLARPPLGVISCHSVVDAPTNPKFLDFSNKHPYFHLVKSFFIFFCNFYKKNAVKNFF